MLGWWYCWRVVPRASTTTTFETMLSAERWRWLPTQATVGDDVAVTIPVVKNVKKNVKKNVNEKRIADDAGFDVAVTLFAKSVCEASFKSRV